MDYEWHDNFQGMASCVFAGLTTLFVSHSIAYQWRHVTHERCLGKILIILSLLLPFTYFVRYAIFWLCIYIKKNDTLLIDGILDGLFVLSHFIWLIIIITIVLYSKVPTEISSKILATVLLLSVTISQIVFYVYKSKYDYFEYPHDIYTHIRNVYITLNLTFGILCILYFRSKIRNIVETIKNENEVRAHYLMLIVTTKFAILIGLDIGMSTLQIMSWNVLKWTSSYKDTNNWKNFRIFVEWWWCGVLLFRYCIMYLISPLGNRIKCCRKCAKNRIKCCYDSENMKEDKLEWAADATDTNSTHNQNKSSETNVEYQFSHLKSISNEQACNLQISPIV